MIKTKINSFTKLVKDLDMTKHPENIYFDAKNIRIITHKDITTGAVDLEKSNSFILNIGSVEVFKNYDTDKYYIRYNNGTEYIEKEIHSEELKALEGNTSEMQVLVGYTNFKLGLVLITTDGNGYDCIWKLYVDNIDDDQFKLELVYLRNLNLSKDEIVQVINNYENDIVDKIYMINGKDQIYHLNINQTVENGYDLDIMDMNLNQIQASGGFNLSAPKVESFSSGGSHVAGTIQYAYTLYNSNGIQTSLSPLSEMVSLAFDNRGGDINEVVNSSPVITVSVDTSYQYIKIYSVHYTSYNQTPSIRLIADEPITSSFFRYVDSGSFIETLSSEQFVFLGNIYLVPKHIESKDNRLFIANYKDRSFSIDKKHKLDFRCFGFPILSSTTEVVNNVTIDSSGNNLIPSGQLSITSSHINNSQEIDSNHSCINLDYDTNCYTFNSTQRGVEGPLLKVEFIRLAGNPGNNKYFKDNEIYRFAIQFYNSYGQVSEPYWMFDFKFICTASETGNLGNNLGQLRFRFKDSFFDWLNDNSNFLDSNGNYDPFLKPVGYKILRGDRTINDRTIICQGLMNGMIANLLGDTTNDNGESLDNTKKNLINTTAHKVPSLMRNYNDSLAPMFKMENYARVDTNNKPHPESLWATREMSVIGAYMASAWQFNSMMQLFSPEILFGDINTVPNSKLKVIGAMVNNYNAGQTFLENKETKDMEYNIRFRNGISVRDKNITVDIFGEGTTTISDYATIHEYYGHISPGENDGWIRFIRSYREYNTINKYGTSYESEIYGGRPLVTEKGQGRTVYNNDLDYVFYNGWTTFTGDQYHKYTNSYGQRCLTMVLGNSSNTTTGRPSLDYIKNQISSSIGKHALVGEIVLSRVNIYTSGIYGGNTLSAKSRTNYIEIGDYVPLADWNPVYNLRTGGDTYIQMFKFMKFGATDVEPNDRTIPEYTEFVNFKVETTIDLSKRNDTSNNDWFDKFKPKFEEYHKYNLVYSQQPNLLLRRSNTYNRLYADNRYTSIMASKMKINGEMIDSWLDFQVNETLDVDGKYGSINSLVNFKDRLYCFQDNGVSVIGVNPRVQIANADGKALELGTGGVLHDYTYITTTSGSVNKWGIVSTPFGIIYADYNNRSIMLINDGIKSISDSAGMHSEFQNLLSNNELRKDLPLINKGIILGYDKNTDDLYIGVFNDNNITTWVYNVKSESFITKVEYDSKFYMGSNGKMITINHNNEDLMLMYGGPDYLNINGERKSAELEFVVNPEPLSECTFNNLEYKSECIDQDTEVNKTWNKLEVYNEFQSAQVELDRNNMRKMNRKWRITIPRSNVKHRMRNNWIKVKFILDNSEGERLTTHEVATYYTPNYKLIQ